MVVKFLKDSIDYDTKSIKYDLLKTDKVNSILFDILEYCVKNEEVISFECSDDCTPFGLKLKELLENEFVIKEDAN